ncbi:beta-lactamase/transpeptidase-like protein [Microstroma glucosiphilum]|uniref:Beta-lactamase/transpeptidase-like protein n=1 Tax=Pseudomicrostroma glucosiphilum TaxID=1684307 RepID=A0A316UAM6_9BASI|nr:beta-lactamase/transpeptidase-like protein [Pseudomicrostroma glucosiphilum]PWN20085.1 beta-lactamase/transpeptidase-like protein [Pseudomicrostroma glucosiphilum]
MPPFDAKALHSRFQKAIDDGVAPGVQYTVFDRDSTLLSDAIGYARVSATGEKEVKMTTNTFCWLASCSKLSISLIVLHVLERGLAKDGSSLADLDSSLALLRVLPEFDPKSDTYVSKILTGWGSIDPATGKLTPQLTPRKTIPTIRQMLLHTAGLAYQWSSSNGLQKWYAPSPGEGVPQADMPYVKGDIADLNAPSVREAGEDWEYSPSLDWMAIWLQRVTGKSCRQLHREILFEPLGIVDKIDTYVDDRPDEEKAAIHVRNPEGKLVSIPFAVWSCPDLPPKGKFNFGTAMLHGSHQALAATFQACMRRDERILSASTWALALADHPGSVKASLPSPLLESMIPAVVTSMKELNPGSTNVPSLLSTFRNCTTTTSGKPAGSQTWLGLANSYFAFNEEANIGYAYGCSTFPCASEEFVRLREDVERIVFGQGKGQGKAQMNGCRVQE